MLASEIQLLPWAILFLSCESADRVLTQPSGDGETDVHNVFLYCSPVLRSDFLPAVLLLYKKALGEDDPCFHSIKQSRKVAVT